VSSVLVRIPRKNRIDLEGSRVRLGVSGIKNTLPSSALAAVREV